ncbi:hypothetical protein EON67_10635, partial [archaeon]
MCVRVCPHTERSRGTDLMAEARGTELLDVAGMVDEVLVGGGGRQLRYVHKGLNGWELTRRCVTCVQTRSQAYGSDCKYAVLTQRGGRCAWAAAARLRVACAAVHVRHR